MKLSFTKDLDIRVICDNDQECIRFITFLKLTDSRYRQDALSVVLDVADITILNQYIHSMHRQMITGPCGDRIKETNY